MKQKTYLDKLLEDKVFKEKFEEEYTKLTIAENNKKDTLVNNLLKKKQLPKSNENWKIIPGKKLTDEFIDNLVSDFYKKLQNKSEEELTPEEETFLIKQAIGKITS